MTRVLHRTLLSFPLVLTLAAAASGQEFRYGSPSPLGEGTARSYVVVENGQPLEFGIALSESALQGLPEMADVPDEEAFLLLDLAMPEDNPTPYRLASLDWNPRGHTPEMYGVPHFDFHFYLIGAENRDRILPEDPADHAAFETRGSRSPGEGLLPANYVYAPESTVPRMGGHWIDPASHEFHGEAFDSTFIFGTWDGAVIFWEPMITKAYIESRPQTQIEVAIPTRVAEPGWYPTAYRIWHDGTAGEYRIALVDFSVR